MATLIEKKTRQYDDPALRQITARMQEVRERGVNLIRDFVNHAFPESSNVDVIRKRVDMVEKVKQDTTFFIRLPVLADQAEIPGANLTPQREWRQEKK